MIINIEDFSKQPFEQQKKVVQAYFGADEIPYQCYLLIRDDEGNDSKKIRLPFPSISVHSQIRAICGVICHFFKEHPSLWRMYLTEFDCNTHCFIVKTMTSTERDKINDPSG